MRAATTTISASASVPIFSAVRHQPVAPKSAAIRRRHVGHVAVLIGLGIVLALIFVWIRIQVIQLGYEVSKIRRETAELKEQKNHFESKVEELKSPARIEVIAREQLGMRLPQTNEVIMVGNAENTTAN